MDYFDSNDAGEIAGDIFMSIGVVLVSFVSVVAVVILFKWAVKK